MQTGPTVAKLVLGAVAIGMSACLASVDEGAGGEISVVEASQEQNVSEVEQAITSCSEHCDCPLGFYCNHGACSNVNFGPPAPEPWCYCHTQCDWYEHCEPSKYGIYGGGFCRP
jgi:hypothetical protein